MPWDIVREKNPELPKEICMLPLIILDKMIDQEYMEIVNLYVGIPTLAKIPLAKVKKIPYNFALNCKS